MENWNGFQAKTFSFEGHEAIIVFPNDKNKCRNLAIKTEYWDAFPNAVEIDLLKNGFHLCYIKNNNRWATDDDLSRKARFIKFLQTKYKLCNKCVPIGMSCGGLIAIKLAAKFPELVSCLYLDAPVVNYMSCPCGFGIGERLGNDFSEILNALGLKNISELLLYRDTPLDNLPELVENKIPIVMVAGDSDKTVPYIENGIAIEKIYKDNNLPIEIFIKKGCDHHPHGLENPQPVIDFILKHIK